ncbi:DUF4124 domain-containing protein [Mitsuaria sp. GD03876]|uniref:DUF4124 domain-containing protein n=1 Tax=Mitsuaria sp. GD03876 TaxID=2975399 RepID=UPI002447438B|nr:DUF4124 domain-containing protein [Mitsuaria sp. GD03876]MDH0864529.1 DUF4124 domain-containing protein [Mitsuaria sp. GD03876]
MPAIRQAALACLLVAGATGFTAAHAQVWKCVVDGKTHYSDQPCPTKGEPLKSSALQGNVIDTSADRAAAERAKAAADQQAATPPNGAPAAPNAPAASSNVCPSDRDIAGMETKASSISLSPEAKRFVQDEIRRARQCQKGQGNYSAADWNVSKQAVDAQSSLTGGADARRRAEAMHSAANANEGDRIARQREVEDREAQRRLQRGAAR